MANRQCHQVVHRRGGVAARARRRVESGRPVSTWLPEFPDADKILLRHLLNHTSGIADYANEVFLAARPANGSHFTPDELLGFRDPKTLLFAPGLQAVYSNANYLLVGKIIEAVTGKAIVEVLRERLFLKLGLEHTSFAGVDPVLPDTVAHGYADLDGDLDDTLELPWTMG